MRALYLFEPLRQASRPLNDTAVSSNAQNSPPEYEEHDCEDDDCSHPSHFVLQLFLPTHQHISTTEAQQPPPYVEQIQAEQPPAYTPESEGGDVNAEERIAEYADMTIYTIFEILIAILGVHNWLHLWFNR